MPEKSSKTQPKVADQKSAEVENVATNSQSKSSEKTEKVAKTEPKTKSRLPNKSLSAAEVIEKSKKEHDENAKKDTVQKSTKDLKEDKKDNSQKSAAKKSDTKTPEKQESTAVKISVKVAPKISPKPTPAAKKATAKPTAKPTTKITAKTSPKKPESVKTPSTDSIKAQAIKSAKPVKPALKTSRNKKVSPAKPSFLAIFSRNIAGVLGISSIFFIITIIRLNVLPMRYLLLVIAIILVIAMGCGFALWHKKSKTALKVPINIVSILLSCIYFVGGGYIMQASGFLDNLQTQEYISEQYYVIVKNDSSFTNVKDLNGKTVGTFDEGLEIYQAAIKNLQTTVSVNLETSDSVRALTSDLLSNDLDAVLLSAVYKSVLDEDDANFSKETKILYTIEAKVKLETAHEKSSIDVTSKPFTVYISGNDSYGDLSARGLSDVNMLATVNPITHEVLLTSIPRDYYVELHDTPGALDKLTHAGLYGVQMSVQTIEDLLDINIDYYVKINFPALVSLVDAIGGIDVYSDKTFKPLHGDEIIKEGMNHFDGKMALAFARERMAYAWGDRHRVQNQRDVLSAIIGKISSSTVILTKTNEILSSITNNLDTNISKNEISSLVKLQLRDMPSWKIGEFMLNGQDAYEYTYTFGDQLRYVMHPNANSVQAAHNYITGILEDKSLSELNIPQQEPAPGQ